MTNHDFTGLYRRIVCPHCRRKIDLVIQVYMLPARKRKIMGEIENYLSTMELKRFKHFQTVEKITFSIGKFHEVKGKWPSEKELAQFCGLSVQTISKYSKQIEGVCSSSQERALNGKFLEKSFYLNEEGKLKYSQLVYKILDQEKFLRRKKQAIHV